MRYILLTLAVLILQCACANDSTKVKKVKAIDSTKVATPPAPLFTDIIPQPLSLIKGDGRFTINAETVICCDEALIEASDYLRLYIPIEQGKGKKNNSIRLTLDKKLGKEEYTLKVDKSGVEIRGGDYGGVFNAIQSLLQLLPHSIYSKNATVPMELSYIEVADAPQYSYRGFLLDVARTFQPVHEVKRVIDYMALCKLNKLHFHLIDNPAWRIEIKKYPQFAQQGGFRGGDAKLHPIYGRFNQKYGGYYTQDELRDIVAYAAQRNIEVIPEIDMPGHSKSLGAIHPSIFCNYTPDTSHTNGIDVRNVWCAAKESNYALIEDIVKELVEIFPSQYLHIGGDEVGFSQWKKCPDCQALMKKRGLESGEQLEQHFLNRVSKILAKYNRKAVVWDEAVDGGLLPKSTMVTGWRGVKQCLETTAKGYPTIIMPSSVFYLDKRQSPKERGHLSSKGLSLKTICDFSFDEAGFTAEQRKNIAGIEGAFWSEIYLEHINPKGHFSDYLEYMLFPRIFAVSEIAWSKNRRSYDEMMAILKSNFYHKLHRMSATFRLESPKLKIESGRIFASVEDGSKIYYKDIRNNKTQEYKLPLDAKLAQFILFQSQLMTGYSNEVGTAAFYSSQTPTVEITSSMPFSKRYTVERCMEYRGEVRTTRCAKAGDWVLFKFAAPVKSSYIKVATGYAHLRRCLIYNGVVEVSYDGTNFVKAGNLSNGALELRLKGKSIHALRIVAKGISDAEEKVIIQPLIIK